MMWIYCVLFIHLFLTFRCQDNFWFVSIFGNCKHLCAHFCVHIYCQVFWVYTQGMELLGHVFTLHFPFWGATRQFSKWLHHLAFLPAVYEGSNFSIFFPTLTFVLISLLIYLSFCLSRATLRMEVPRLGLQSELWPPAYTTATATPDPSCAYSLHHCSWQCRILSPEWGQGSNLQTHGS